jgi:hypothetical protein
MNACPEDLAESEVDWEFLRRFEASYCQRFTLHELIALDPLMSQAYHHRDIYYHPANKALLYKNLELHLRWLEELFRQIDAEAVITINFQYFIKAAAFTMAQALRIPYLMVSTSRIGDLHLVYDNFSLGTPHHVEQEMRRLQDAGDACTDAAAYMRRIAQDNRPAYRDFEKTLARIHTRMSLRLRLAELWRYLYRYPRKALFIDKHYRGIFRRNYFLPSYFSVLRIMLVSIWRRIGYFRRPELTRTDLPAGPFIYFALHLMPENSVLTLSRTFDEMECLFQLAKALPVGWRVVVKANPNMLADFDTHPNHYYLAMSKLANVQFVHPLVPSAQVLKAARAVAAISGTVLLEGAVCGKPGFHWGRTEFEAVNTIQPFHPERLQRRLEETQESNVRFYLQACINLGFSLDPSVVNHPVATPLDESRQRDYETQIAALEQALARFLLPERRPHPAPAPVA